ncbi:hypothetical protein DERP_001031 [Dermatophagoides pteronyssinus]|uniref:Uncharacterized protein n=1 Tax=Dermatophagoides pteronyssinus TaxID=6956 RepID=A0ABQ8JDC2_DERPT|nr:hypothetical protein DERP_001031 [Dermatophagoides pteronyssinus]
MPDMIKQKNEKFGQHRGENRKEKNGKEKSSLAIVFALVLIEIEIIWIFHCTDRELEQCYCEKKE